MFRRGRPGRPLMAGALVVGASRSAARREVSAQGQYAAESQRTAERSQREEDERVATAIERSRREDRERDRKTTLAIDEAIARERSRGRSPLPARVQDRHGAYQSPPPNGVSYDVHDQGALPAYPANDVNMEGVDCMREMGGRSCASCGCMRTWQDKYCAGCGRKLAAVVTNEQENVNFVDNVLPLPTEARLA